MLETAGPREDFAKETTTYGGLGEFVGLRGNFEKEPRLRRDAWESQKLRGAFIKDNDLGRTLETPGASGGFCKRKA